MMKIKKIDFCWDGGSAQLTMEDDSVVWVDRGLTTKTFGTIWDKNFPGSKAKMLDIKDEVLQALRAATDDPKIETYASQDSLKVLISDIENEQPHEFHRAVQESIAGGKPETPIYSRDDAVQARVATEAEINSLPPHLQERLKQGSTIVLEDGTVFKQKSGHPLFPRQHTRPSVNQPFPRIEHMDPKDLTEDQLDEIGMGFHIDHGAFFQNIVDMEDQRRNSYADCKKAAKQERRLRRKERRAYRRQRRKGPQLSGSSWIRRARITLGRMIIGKEK